jgi:hypothetical protein
MRVSLQKKIWRRCAKRIWSKRGDWDANKEMGGDIEYEFGGLAGKEAFKETKIIGLTNTLSALSTVALASCSFFATARLPKSAAQLSGVRPSCNGRVRARGHVSKVK